MSNSYIFSILGAYNHDPSIFDGLQLPSNPFTTGYPDLFKNFPELDKATLVSNLLLDCAHLSLLHTDTDFLKEEIRLWSLMHSLDWAQMYETMLYHYNPIWNKDGAIVESETHSETGTNSGVKSTTGTSGNVRNIEGQEQSSKTGTNENERTTGHTDVESLTGSDAVSETATEDSTVVNSVNAYNSGSPTEHDRSKGDIENTASKTVSYGKTTTTTGEGSITDSGSDSMTGSGQHEETITDSGNTSENTTDSGEHSLNESREYSKTETGNIGVTTTQQMIQAQRDIIMNMYQYIIGQFKERFCVLIW